MTGLYLTSVLIWGSTWLAITFQFGIVPPAVSVVYRFTLAGVVLLAWARLKGLRLRFPPADHLGMALQGFLVFGINYMCVYLADVKITSGLVAVASPARTRGRSPAASRAARRAGNAGRRTLVCPDSRPGGGYDDRRSVDIEQERRVGNPNSTGTGEVARESPPRAIRR